MKKFLYINLLFALILGASSCSENETPVYDAERTSLNIWFGQSNSKQDSVTYNYSYALDEGSLTFMARVAGVPTDYDRTFTLEAVKGDIAEAEGSYRVETYIIPAGEIEVECSLYFNTSMLKNASSFTTNDGYLHFRVAKNDAFEAGAAERQELIVILKNYLAEPEEWNNRVPPYYSWANYFGEYSKVKYQFMIQELGIMEFHIYGSATAPYNESTKEMSVDYARYLCEVLNDALDKYEETHGERLMDEFGREVKF